MFNFCKISFKRGTDVILKTIKHKLAGLSLLNSPLSGLGNFHQKPLWLLICSLSQSLGRHVYLTLQDKFYYVLYRPRPARIVNFARRPNCNGDSFPVLCRDYHDRSHDLIGLHITLRLRTCPQDCLVPVRRFPSRDPKRFGREEK